MRDRDVRSAVLAHLGQLHRDDASTRIVEEMGIWSGAVRIDIAVINGELSGYELKSDRDTLERLPTQADLYSRVFDQVTLVVGSRHASKAAEIIPDWWGILRATESQDGVVLEPVRAAIRNADPEPYLVAELLWKDEALSILDEFGLARGWRSKRIRAIHERLASELPFHVLAERVRSALKSRPQWLLGQQRSDQLDMAVDA